MPVADCCKLVKVGQRGSYYIDSPAGLTERRPWAEPGWLIRRTSLAHDATLRSCCRNQTENCLTRSSLLQIYLPSIVALLPLHLDLEQQAPKSTRTPDGRFWYWNHFLLYSVNAEVLPISGGFIMNRPFCTRTRKTEDIKAIRKPQPMKSATALVLRLLGTTQQTSPSGSDETRLLTRHSVTVDGGGFSDMLVVTLWWRVRCKSLKRKSDILTPP